MAAILVEPRVRLRPVVRADRDLLRRWRNDPTTRRWFGEPRPITHYNHARWFNRRLRETAPWYIAIVDDEPAGCVRFEGGDGHYEVSILVPRKWRQVGIGAEMLARACARHKEVIHATILHGNVASEALFQRCGFRQVATTWERTP